MTYSIIMIKKKNCDINWEHCRKFCPSSWLIEYVEPAALPGVVLGALRLDLLKVCAHLGHKVLRLVQVFRTKNNITFFIVYYNINVLFSQDKVTIILDFFLLNICYAIFEQTLSFSAFLSPSFFSYNSWYAGDVCSFF